jgi:nucleotide-binding universal stress UspA family protein
MQLPHPPEYCIEYFDPAPDVILRVALALPANLIVLSVRPEQGWATRLPDKAYRIVAESLCPVLSARERESA